MWLVPAPTRNFRRPPPSGWPEKGTKLQFLPYQKKSYLASLFYYQYNLMMDNKTTGTVKFFNADKGFGFIKHDDSNKETFVHASGLIDQVKENDHVEFDLQNGKKGLNAVNVKLIR